MRFTAPNAIFLFFQMPIIKKTPMANLAEQLINALTTSGAPKMCITTPGSNANGVFQPPMQLTLELLNRDGSVYSVGEKRALDSESVLETKQQDGKRQKKEKVTRVKNKVLDMAASLEKYATRIKEYPNEDFKEFHDAYITDYKLHTSTKEDSPPTSHVYRLAEIAAERGATVRGFVSANRKEGNYVQALPDGQLRKDEGGNAEIVYVGDKNQFTNQPTSKWALTRQDKVFNKIK